MAYQREKGNYTLAAQLRKQMQIDPHDPLPQAPILRYADDFVLASAGQKPTPSRGVPRLLCDTLKLGGKRHS